MHLAAADRAEGAPDVAVDRALDEADAAVAEQGVHAAGVVAPRGEGPVDAAGSC